MKQNKCSGLSKIVCFLFALFLAFSMAIPALAAIPAMPPEIYVLDEADVLEPETEKWLIAENKKLFDACGGEIVIVTVDFVGGQDIRDYTQEIFNTWGIGSKENNNGLLLVMSIGDDDYYSEMGLGTEDFISIGVLQKMLNDDLEPYFAAQDYDGGAKAFFRAAYQKYENYYGSTNTVSSYSGTNGGTAPGYTSPYTSGPNMGGIITVVVAIFVLIIFLIIISSICSAAASGGGGGCPTICCFPTRTYAPRPYYGGCCGPRRPPYYGYGGGYAAPPPYGHPPTYPPYQAVPPPQRSPYSSGGYGSGSDCDSGSSSGGFSRGGSSSSGFGRSSGGFSSGRSSGGFSRGGSSRGSGGGRGR